MDYANSDIMNTLVKCFVFELFARVMQLFGSLNLTVFGLGCCVVQCLSYLMDVLYLFFLY